MNPNFLGEDKIKIITFKKLGVGEGNINYLFKIKNRKFICRVNIDEGVPNKSRDEFNSLKKVEILDIAPKAYYYHPKTKVFPLGFIILDFIEGKSWRKKKRAYSQSQIKQLAKKIGALHKRKATGLKKKHYKYSDYLFGAKEHVKDISRYSNNKLKQEFLELHKAIAAGIPKKEKYKFSLIHDDLCPQNIVEQNNAIKLIDWESLKYSDPAKDISRILIDFELKGNNLKLFMKEYHKINNDKEIMKRAKVYAVLNRYVYVLWELVRSFEIINKELPKEYLKQTTAQRHINEAKHQFRKLKKLLGLPRINIDVLFK